MTRSAESYESEIRYWRDMAQRLHQRLEAANNLPETHADRGLTRDPTGNTAASRADRKRKKRK